MSKEQSAIIKGFAILFVFIAHLGCIRGIQGLDNIVASTLITFSRQSITYFLIVSGYGLYYTYQRGRLTWSYLLKRSVRLYLAFWLILLIFVYGIASWMYPDRFHYAWNAILLNFLGWRWDYCKFTWFLLPYILMCLSAKWIFPLLDRVGIIISVLVALFLYYAASAMISFYYDPFLRSHYWLYHVVMWSQTLFGLVVGASMAKLVTAGKSIVWNKIYGNNLIVIPLLLLAIVIRGQIGTSVVDPIHAALVVWLLLHIKWGGFIKKVFTEFGDKCMIIWLAQGFLAVYMFSEYILLLHYPLLIWLVWALVCYIVACLLNPVVNALARALRLT